MLLKTDKTKASQNRLHLHNDILHLTYNNDALNTVENEKVLGVCIDNNLTGSDHINFIAKKISSNIWLLSKWKTIYPMNTEYNFTKHIFNIFRLQKITVKIIENDQL